MINFDIISSFRTEFISITEQVKKAVEKSGIRQGICTIFIPHTTAGVFINENADPDVASDVLAYFNKIVPERSNYKHLEGNSDAHIKSILTGSSACIPIYGGKLILGTWQGIFFAEFDGPRKRCFSVSCTGSNSDGTQ